MDLIVQLLLQLLVPAVLLIDLYRKDYRQRRDWSIDVTLVAVVLLFIFLTARWDWFSYYLRILLWPAFGLVAFVAYRSIDRKKKTVPAALTLKEYAAYGTKGLIVLVTLVLNVHIISSSFSPAGAVLLSYPLRGGIYYVGGGGSSRWINNHHAFLPQQYALDIVGLNAFGNRASGLKPNDLDWYAIFGDVVYSPCNGRIVSAEDGHPDSLETPGVSVDADAALNVDADAALKVSPLDDRAVPGSLVEIPPVNFDGKPAGNYVVVACEGVKVLLAHLQRGSVSVAVGEEVTAGFALGQVGSSGKSSQPHLHIHAESGGSVGAIFEGEGVPMHLNGRFLVRNSLFSGRTQSDN